MIATLKKPGSGTYTWMSGPYGEARLSRTNRRHRVRVFWRLPSGAMGELWARNVPHAIAILTTGVLSR